jgi:hypothetical protein
VHHPLGNGGHLRSRTVTNRNQLRDRQTEFPQVRHRFMQFCRVVRDRIELSTFRFSDAF